jgi:tetratricopeptide (TPR) repeat protein
MGEQWPQARLSTPLPRMLVDRDAERRELTDLIVADLAAGRPAVCVLRGMSGAGKTTLALWCAHELRDTMRFTDLVTFDDVLEIRLGRFARAQSVDDALTVLLPALGVELPRSRQGLLPAYRDRLARRSVLLVLDDVENAEQLVDLLPPSPRSVVIATSRRRAEGFIYHDFHVIEVRDFTLNDATELLSYGMDRQRAAAEAADLRELATLCSRQPLALGVTRAVLHGRHGGRAASLVERLRTANHRLSELSVDGERLVLAEFDEAYHDKPERVRKLYRRLGLHPGDEFDLRVAEALADLDDVAFVEEDLHTMVSAGLLIELGSGRFELHLLVRLHTDSLRTEHDAPADCRDALYRMVRRYLEYAVARELVLSDRQRFGELFRDGRIRAAYEGEHAYERAIADLEQERANLRRVVSAAADEGSHVGEEKFLDVAWQLCEALPTFYFQRDLYDDAIEVDTVGLACAQALYRVRRDPRPVFRMHTELGTAYFAIHDHAAARAHFEQATEAAAEFDDDASLVALAKALVWQALVHQRLGEYARAVALIERSRALVRDPRFPARLREREDLLLDMNVGPTLAALGRSDEAIAAGRRALAFFAGGKEAHNHAKSMANLGTTLARAGATHTAEAVAVLTEAMALEDAAGLASWLADTKEVLGDLLVGLGRVDEGRRLRAEAAALFEELGDRADRARPAPE